MRVLVKLYVAKIDKGHMENVTLVSWLNMMKAVGYKMEKSNKSKNANNLTKKFLTYLSGKLLMISK